MLNGVKDYTEWETVMTKEQRDYKLFEVLCSLDQRLKKLERTPFYYKTASFLGGVVGGMAVFLVGIFKNIFFEGHF